MKARALHAVLFNGTAILIAVTILAACAPAMSPTIAPAPTQAGKPSIPSTPSPAATHALMPTSAPAYTEEVRATEPVIIIPTEIPPIPVELRVLELEWPVVLKLGDSDVIRLSLIPSEDGYTAKAEYAEHTLTAQDVPVKRPEGYTLSAMARLDGAGFQISPAGEQRFIVSKDETVTWRWSLSPQSPGSQRVSILLTLRWEPDEGVIGAARESIVYNRSLDIEVISFLGLRKPEVLAFGFTGLAFSLLLGVWVWAGKRAVSGKRISIVSPDKNLSIEAAPSMILNTDEKSLMQALFARYQRLILQREFLSGYSGARTFLARPVKPGGLSDAETIIKIGPRPDIELEYEHYNNYVKDRLPPITARIQSAPVAIRGGSKAALQYTCITEPGKSPTSLRQALLTNPDPFLIQRLFDTFATYWWMQRQPYTFRLGQEYDRLLPPHLVLEPAVGPAKFVLRSDLDPANLPVVSGELVSLPVFEHTEIRADGKSLTLFGPQLPGRPALRIRWLSLQPPTGAVGRVVCARRDLLAQFTAGYDLLGLPDPLPRLDGWLQEVVAGSRSVIHGDLNLENILVGPGSLVWLIDFAQTREGHPLFDFSHLASELVAHILVQQYPDPRQYLHVLRADGDPLLQAVERVAALCLFDPHNPREYRLALTLACLGALKYQNLEAQAKHYLYLTAAYYGA